MMTKGKRINIMDAKVVDSRDTSKVERVVINVNISDSRGGGYEN